MINVKDYIDRDRMYVIVTPNARKTEVLGWDATKKRLKIAVAAVPDKDKANRELLRFLEQETKRSATLMKGLRTREKLIFFR